MLFLPALFISEDMVASLVFPLSVIVPPSLSSAPRTGSSMSNTLHTLLCCSLILTECIHTHSPFSPFLRSIFSPAPVLFSKSFACLYCEIMTLRWFL
ncbi:hypothetical protein BGX38DRAFT_1176434, partial [Terfezia claveryi]